MKKNLVKNVYISILQITLSTIVIFILYKYSIGILGADKFGLWSVITSVVSLANVVNLGFSASVTSYVAKFQANNEEDYSISFQVRGVVRHRDGLPFVR